MKSKPIIIPPKQGWREQSYYLVEASFSKGNPISHYVFYTGFISRDGQPAGYNVFCRTEDQLSLSDAVFCRAICRLHSPGELENTNNKGKLPDSPDLTTSPLC